MPSTHSKILLHAIFSTKNRVMAIKAELQDRLYALLGGIVRDEHGTLLAAGGLPDHVHLLVRWRTDGTVADLMRNVKARSSAWIHATFPAQAGFHWQTGYGVFSVSQSQSDVVQRYIHQQVEHHRGQTFQEEFMGFLKAHEVEYDERYLWD